MAINVNIDIDTQSLLDLVKQKVEAIRADFLEEKREQKTERVAEDAVKKGLNQKPPNTYKEKNSLYEYPFTPPDPAKESFLDKAQADWGMGWLYIQKIDWIGNPGSDPRSMSYLPLNIKVEVWSGDKSKKASGIVNHSLFESSILHVLPVKKDHFIVSLIGRLGENLSFLVSNNKVKKVVLPVDLADDINKSPYSIPLGRVGWLLQSQNGEDAYMYPPSQQQLSIEEEEINTTVSDPPDPYSLWIYECNNGFWASNMPTGFVLGSPAHYKKILEGDYWNPGVPASEQGMNSPPLYLSEKSNNAWSKAEGGPFEQAIEYNGFSAPIKYFVRPARTYGLFTQNNSSDYIVEELRDGVWQGNYRNGELYEDLQPGRPTPLSRRVSPSGDSTINPTVEFRRRLFWQFSSDATTGQDTPSDSDDGGGGGGDDDDDDDDDDTPDPGDIPTGPGVGPASAVAVIDEDTSYLNAFREQDWLQFRENNPYARIIIIKPTPPTQEGADVTLPKGWDGEIFEMKRGSTSEWFDFVFPSGPVQGWNVSIFLDESGSTVKADWEVALDIFLEACSSYGISVQEFDDTNHVEEYLYPFAYALGTERPPDGEIIPRPEPDGEPDGEPNWENPLEANKYVYVDSKRARFFMLLSNPWNEDWSERLQSAGLSESSLEF